MSIRFDLRMAERNLKKKNIHGYRMKKGKRWEKRPKIKIKTKTKIKDNEYHQAKPSLLKLEKQTKNKNPY